MAPRTTGVDVEDHVPSRFGTGLVMEQVSAIAHELGIEVICDRGRSRILLGNPLTPAEYRSAREALTSFQEREDMAPAMAYFEPKEIKRAIAPPKPPTRTLWEQLYDEDLDGV